MLDGEGRRGTWGMVVGIIFGFMDLRSDYRSDEADFFFFLSFAKPYFHVCWNGRSVWKACSLEAMDSVFHD